MKKLSKFIALLLCAVMTFCLFSFVGCANGKLKKIIEAISAQEVKALALEADLSMQVKQNGATESLKLSLDSKMNIDKGELDLAMYTSVVAPGQLSNAYIYEFLREDALFMYTDYIPVSDWTNKILTIVDLSEILDAENPTWTELVNQLGSANSSLIDLEADSTAALGEELYFFDFMGSLSIKKNVITIDLNNFLYKLSRDLISILKDLEGDTTLSEILNHRTVKKYLKHFLRDKKAEDVQSDLKEFLEEMPENMLPSTVRSKLNDLANVAPKKREAATDYLLRLLNSEEFEAVMKASGLNFSLEKTTFDDLIGDLLYVLYGENWKEDLIDALKKFTKKELKFSLHGDSVTFSNLKMEYVLNEDNTLSSAEFTSKVVAKAKGGDQATIDLSYGFNCYSQAIALTDISGASVDRADGFRFSHVDGVFLTNFSMNLTVEEPVYIPSVQLTYSPVYKSGRLVDFEVRQLDPDQGTVILDSEYDPQAETLSFVLELDEGVSCEVNLKARIYLEGNSAYVEIWPANNDVSVYSYKYLGETSPVLQTVAQYLASN